MPREWRNGDSAMEQEALFTVRWIRTNEDYILGLGGEQQGLIKIRCPTFLDASASLEATLRVAHAFGLICTK